VPLSVCTSLKPAKNVKLHSPDRPVLNCYTVGSGSYSFVMKRSFRALLRISLIALCPAVPVLGQRSTQELLPSNTLIQHAVDQAAAGACQDALKVLKKSAARVSDKQLRYPAEMAAVRCAMSLGDFETSIQMLLVLNRDFPDDPQVLYISTHYYSELAQKASQRIATVAPKSHQAHQLEAEALESQEKWEEAANEYRKILEQDPKVPGIHYRLARIALSRPQTPETVEEGKNELEAELLVDPTNAAAIFFLGEMARQAASWDEAITRFSKAAQLDPGFAEAFLALGMSLNSASRFQEAVSPLERYVKMVPDDPAGHYQLSVAYARTGRKADATREIGIQQQLAQRREERSRTPQ
jgi:tetratricopeptide (TPR) repeat protein